MGKINRPNLKTKLPSGNFWNAIALTGFLIGVIQMCQPFIQLWFGVNGMYAFYFAFFLLGVIAIFLFVLYKVL